MKATDAAVQALVKNGAAILFPHAPHLGGICVTVWRRIDAQRHFWHSTGMSDFDHHRLAFATEELEREGEAVTFRDANGVVVARLARIADAAESPQEAEQMLSQVRRWRREFESNAYFRRSVREAFRVSKQNPQ